MTLVNRLLVVLALGMLATGLVIGFLPGGDCGAAFSHPNSFKDPNGCATDRAHRRELPVALLGLGLTAAVGALVTYDAEDRRRASEVRS